MRLSLDTEPDVERRLVEAWRGMSPATKAAAIAGLTRAACAMTYAGVRARHPDASPHEQFLRVACIMLGPELVWRVYPGASTLVEK